MRVPVAGTPEERPGRGRLQDPLGLGHFVMQVKPFASCPDRSVAVVRIGTRKAVLHPQLLAGMGVEAQRPSSQPH